MDSTGRPGDASEEYKIVFRTDDQTHFFNCPFQIGTNSNDGPEKADQVELDVASGDVVVAATDGVFDNLFDEDVERELNNALGKDAGHGEEGTEALLQEAVNQALKERAPNGALRVAELLLQSKLSRFGALRAYQK